MATCPSSSGWRITSSTLRRNSGNSSRNSTPRCASDTSPGTGCVPPPSKPASDTVWCGARNGRRTTSDSRAFSTPATEWMRVTSSASSGVRGGRMDGIRRASIVLPAPGDPTMSRLCPPATATSIARFAPSWPFTSAKSSPESRFAATHAARSVRTGVSGSAPERKSTASRRLRTGYTSMPSTTDASSAFSSGTRMPRFPMRRISSTIGRMPRTRRTSPDNASSPASA